MNKTRKSENQLSSNASRRLFVFSCAAILASSGCVSYTKIDSGKVTIEGITFSTNVAWNQAPAKVGAATLLTREGLPLDRLLIFSNVEPGTALLPNRNPQVRPSTFRASMPNDQLVTLFDQMLRADGSEFTLTNSQLVDFMGSRGIRFEFKYVRKSDNTIHNGLAYAAVLQGKLNALLFHAPRLHFFPSLVGSVDALMKSAIR
jgi:hypothetical protein